jgi:hypothetical protein
MTAWTIRVLFAALSAVGLCLCAEEFAVPAAAAKLPEKHLDGVPTPKNIAKDNVFAGAAAAKGDITFIVPTAAGMKDKKIASSGSAGSASPTVAKDISFHPEGVAEEAGYFSKAYDTVKKSVVDTVRSFTADEKSEKEEANLKLITVLEKQVDLLKSSGQGDKAKLVEKDLLEAYSDMAKDLKAQKNLRASSRI